MKLLYRRQWTKNGAVIIVITVFILLGLYFGNTKSMQPSLKEPGNGIIQSRKYNGNEDINVLKQHLVIMRKYLQAVNNSKSEPVYNLKNSTSLLKALNSSDIEKSKKILAENADLFKQIAGLIEQVGWDNRENNEQVRAKSEAIPASTPHRTARERQVQRIKDMQPFYINIDVGSSAEENEMSRKSIKALETWDLFAVDFPSEQAQDKVLSKWQLPKEISNKLADMVLNEKPGVRSANLTAVSKLKIYNSKKLYTWQRFHQHITQYQLYNPNDPHFKRVIQELQTLPIIEVYQPTGGTQQKLILVLRNSLRVIFKPMRFSRGQETLPDHMFWRDYERHFAEIAAFHLDMAFGFHRVPPVVGRYINLTSEVQQLDVKNELTFFRSPAGNLCFYGKCDYYCDTGHAVCGRPEIMEGSLMMYLPTTRYIDRLEWENPWKRTYSKSTPKAEWQLDRHYCDKVKVDELHKTGRRLLDLMDITVFDFIAGNMDRHHYETFEPYGNMSLPILFDNGRGFGKTMHDELTILAPIYQCCLIRYSTFKKLVTFDQGRRHLSDVMRDSLSNDLANPVLLEPHLKALDRRLQMILKTVHTCIEQKSYSDVVIYDGL